MCRMPAPYRMYTGWVQRTKKIVMCLRFNDDGNAVHYINGSFSLPLRSRPLSLVFLSSRHSQHCHRIRSLFPGVSATIPARFVKLLAEIGSEHEIPIICRCSWQRNCRILPDQTDNIQYLCDCLNCFEISPFIHRVVLLGISGLWMVWMRHIDILPTVYVLCVWRACAISEYNSLTINERKIHLSLEKCHYQKFSIGRERERENKRCTFHRVFLPFYSKTIQNRESETAVLCVKCFLCVSISGHCRMNTAKFPLNRRNRVADNNTQQ